MTKLTVRQRDVLAFIHLTGREPRRTHMRTTIALFEHRTRQPFTLDGPSLLVNDASLPLIEGRPLVKAVALFESHGFALPEKHGDRVVQPYGRKSTQYVYMLRESDGVAVRLWKCGTSATVDVDTGSPYPITEYVCLTGKHATPLPEIVTEAPAGLSADEFDLLSSVGPCPA
jgi:hypothetical protein